LDIIVLTNTNCLKIVLTLVNLSRNNERFMKKILIILLLGLIIKPESNAQTNKYFDAPFGGGGGFTPAWFTPNVDPLNQKLQQLGIPELSKNGIFTTGGGGYIYIGFIKNLRVGGMGFGGSTSESTTSGGINYETNYSIGGGGLTVEYTLPFIKDIGVSVGAILGGGSIDIEFFKNSSSYTWDNILNENPNNTMERLTNNYWIVTPTLNIDIPVYRFVALRIGTGYQFAIDGEWEVNNNQIITSVPDDLNGNSFFIQIGIFAGFFSF
jgi:hypothetical protein